MFKKNTVFVNIFLSLGLLLSIEACENGKFTSRDDLKSENLNMERSRLDLEKSRLELEKELLRTEKERILKETKDEKIKDISRKAQSFYSSPQAIVTSDRAYFHNAPDFNTRRKAYLVRGDLITALKVSNNFVYVEFYSEYLKKTSNGWINVEDIEHISDSY